ncbi:hypothetical protein [Pseudophaeobacter sp.]|uniref:hypothetical protein n=1 Tax=Pseudophaeobacter sp. TaxID=1971739 RepID=UPI0040596AFB
MTTQDLAKETAVVSLAYLVAFFATFEILMPVQTVFFPDFGSRASLLFLPHGVRVLAAWLLGWRSLLALLPGVVTVFVYVAGIGAFVPSRIAAIVIAVTVPAAVFHLLRLIGWDLFPARHRRPCWPCIMVAGLVISLVTSLLTNYAFGSAPEDYIAYLIGDVFGLFFLMLILMLSFRHLRRDI